MNLQKWFEAGRSPGFVWQRARSLLARYGVSPDKAIQRIDACMETLAASGCAPTFATPGIVVQRYPGFIKHLQDAGAEIAVHSYQHLDLRTMPVTAAKEQLARAVQTFERFGIQIHGFRCPYLGWSTELLDSLPAGMFDYSSNKAIYWELTHLVAKQSPFFQTLCQFYRGSPASESVCLPSTHPNLIEIPVCVPDDLQLHDGLKLDSEGIGQAWDELLKQVYRRGDVFTLIFHPELASFYDSPFLSLLRKASQYQPPVWIARLCDIGAWWQEKARFKVEYVETSAGLRLCFTCTPRATILIRGLEPSASWQTWHTGYTRLQSRTLDVPRDPRPFVGVPASAPVSVISFLLEQGYIVDMADTAARCAIYLDSALLDRMTEVELVNHIENSPGPLVRYWRWPDGAKCALCVTGDLDALTLLDYASRLYVA